MTRYTKNVFNQRRWHNQWKSSIPIEFHMKKNDNVFHMVKIRWFRMEYEQL